MIYAVPPAELAQRLERRAHALGIACRALTKWRIETLEVNGGHAIAMASLLKKLRNAAEMECANEVGSAEAQRFRMDVAALSEEWQKTK